VFFSSEINISELSSVNIQNVFFKVTVDIQGPILSKIIFYTKFKTSTLSEFCKENYFKDLKHE